MKAHTMKIIQMQHMIARALMGACGVAILAYAVLLASTMFFATETTSYHRQIAEATGSLSEMEFEYITLKQSVTLGKAYELGFQDVEKPVFVRADQAVAVSLR